MQEEVRDRGKQRNGATVKGYRKNCTNVIIENRVRGEK